MNWNPMRAIDWIWHVRGAVRLPTPSVSLSVLAPVFEERGTTLEQRPDRLVFHKDNPDSQDRLASFEHGTLEIVPAENGAALRYDLTSHPLLWCFIAPVPFAALAYAAESMRIPGYSFAGIFAVLYVAGRIIEQRQAHRLFRDKLVAGEAEPMPA